MENIKTFLLNLKNPNTMTFKSLIIVLMLSLTVIPLSYAIFKNIVFVDGTLATAIWNVTLVQDGIDNDLTVVPGSSDATYTLNIKSLSEVDVKYSITLMMKEQWDFNSVTIFFLSVKLSYFKTVTIFSAIDSVFISKV